MSTDLLFLDDAYLRSARSVVTSVDGVRVRTTKRGDGLWRPRVRLRGFGKHRITVRAEDRAGNVARSKRYVTRR